MVEKLNYPVAIAALHSICEESSHLVNSGDQRIAGEARRDYLTSSILLQLLSGTNEEEFTNTELAKLPTPEELMATDNSLAATIVASNVPSPAPQPQSADDLEQQNSGVQSVVTDTTANTPADETASEDHLTNDDLASSEAIVDDSVTTDDIKEPDTSTT